MGDIIEYRKAVRRNYQSKLLIYCDPPEVVISRAVSINKPLAKALSSFPLQKRSLQMENCLKSEIVCFPDNVVIRDIDVLFNPAYRIDVLKLLISAYRYKPFSIVWSGSYSKGKLIYSQEGFLDYKVYDIENYDVLCIV